MTELIDLDCYKDYKGVTSTTRDGKIQSLITQISALIESYCNRKFVEHSTTDTAKVEWFDGKTNLVYLDEFPVISIVSVTTSGNGGVTQTAMTEGASDKTGFFADLEEGTVFTQISVNDFITDYDVSYRSLEITYKAGYTKDTLPEDLKLVAMDLVAYYENSENKPTQALFGATIDNPQPYAANSFPPHIRRILDLYRYSPN